MYIVLYVICSILHLCSFISSVKYHLRLHCDHCLLDHHAVFYYYQWQRREKREYEQQQQKFLWILDGFCNKRIRSRNCLYLTSLNDNYTTFTTKTIPTTTATRATTHLAQYFRLNILSVRDKSFVRFIYVWLKKMLKQKELIGSLESWSKSIKLGENAILIWLNRLVEKWLNHELHEGINNEQMMR